jgi:phage tail P2-like protein
VSDIYSINLLDILPESLKSDLDVEALAIAISEEMNRVSAETNKLLLLENLDDQPERVVDMLAWQQHVDYYDSSLTIEQKRELVRNSEFLHRYKGTPAAVEELVNTLFGEGEVVEWYEYGGLPYRFKVVTNNWSVPNELSEEFTRALDSVKNKRSRLDKVELSIADEMDLYFAGVVHIGENLKVWQVV